MATKRRFQETIDGQIGQAHVDAWVDYSVDSLKENTDNLITALNRNSESADYLAKVGIFIGIVGAIATVIGTIFGILEYIKP